MLEPLMDICSRQIFIILFCLKKKSPKVKQSKFIVILDFLGYFTIISNIQTYTGFIVERSLAGFLQIGQKCCIMAAKKPRIILFVWKKLFIYIKALESF